MFTLDEERMSKNEMIEIIDQEKREPLSLAIPVDIKIVVPKAGIEI